MGSLKTLALAGALASVTASYAFAGDLPAQIPAGLPEAPVEAPSGDDSGLYLRGDLGVGIGSVGSLSVREANGDSVAGLRTYDEDAGTALIGGIGVGYAFNSWLRFDVTGEYRGGARLSGRDRYPLGPTPNVNNYDAEWSSIVGMANAYVDLGTFCELGCITPYIGAGIGYANHSISGFQDAGGDGEGSTTYGYGKNVSDSGLAWALMAGLAYQVNDKLTLDLGYRYMNFGDLPTVKVTNAAFDADAGRVTFKDVSSHDIRFGMRWTLGGSDCCGSAPAASEPLMRRY
jgi:opacity protein-like surface antigen